MRSTRKKEEDLGVRTDGFDNHFKRHYPRNLFAILVGWSSSFSIFLFFCSVAWWLMKMMLLSYSYSSLESAWYAVGQVKPSSSDFEFNTNERSSSITQPSVCGQPNGSNEGGGMFDEEACTEASRSEL